MSEQTLTGKNISATYKRLLQVADSDNGVDDTLEVIRDGNGDATSIWLATNTFQVKGVADNAATFDVKDSDNNSVLLVDTSNQAVGINAAPSTTATLRVSDDAAETVLAVDNTATDGDPVIKYQLGGSTSFTMGVDDGDSDKFKIGTTGVSTNTRLTIDSSGNVGIGNPAPDSKLELSTAAAENIFKLSCYAVSNEYTNIIRMEKASNNTLNTYGSDADSSANEALGRIEAWGCRADGTATYSSYIEFEADEAGDADSVPGAIIFATSDADDASTPTPRMTIDNSGNIGINKSPDTNAALSVASLSGATTRVFEGYANNIDGTRATIYVNDSSAFGAFYTMDEADDDSTAVIAKTYFGSVDGSIGLTVAAAGQVGINKTAPSCMLEVRQSSLTGATPVLRLDQDDVDESFIDFIGNSSDDALSSISQLNGTFPNHQGGNDGWIRIEVNGAHRWIPFFETPA